MDKIRYTDLVITFFKLSLHKSTIRYTVVGR